MKKILSVITIILVVVFLAGCSNEPTASQKTDEELRAELKAELKAEMEAEEKQKEESNKDGNTEEPSANPAKDPAESKDDNQPADSQPELINASELKENDGLNDFIGIMKVIHTPGENFGIGLSGEFPVTGDLYYDDYYGAFVLNVVDIDDTIPGIIYEINNTEYQLNPPQGAYFMEGNNLDLLNLQYGHDLEPELSEGIKFKVDAKIDEYSFYTELGTEPSWTCVITEVSRVEPDGTVDDFAN